MPSLIFKGAKMIEILHLCLVTPLSFDRVGGEGGPKNVLPVIDFIAPYVRSLSGVNDSYSLACGNTFVFH